MSRDVLERAAEALREEHQGSSAKPDETERRILASVRKTRRTQWRLRILLPIAAAFVASAAWAGATGRLRPALGVVEALFTGGDRPAPAPPRASSEPTASSTPAIVKAPPVAPSAEPSAIPTPPVAPAPDRSAPPRAASAAPAPAHVAPSADADALYRAAHDAHFVRHDYAAAIVAWDRYLAAAPNGPLSIEARYNRAIALVRVGRDADAKAALAPFAAGEYGPYRQAEAKSLVEMLDRRTR